MKATRTLSGALAAALLATTSLSALPAHAQNIDVGARGLAVSKLPLTGGTLSGALTENCGIQTVAAICLGINVTWNNAAGLFTGFRLSATDTNSLAGSNLFDLQLNSVSRLLVSKSGTVTIFDVSANALYNFDTSGNGVRVAGQYSIGWTSGNANAATPDLRLWRDAAGILACRNGVNPCALRVYNTFTDPSNGEWAALNWTDTANVLTLGTKANGTGQARNLQFVVGGVDVLDYGVTTGGIWTANGIFKATGDVRSGASFEATAAGNYSWSGRSRFFSTGNGTITFSNAADNARNMMTVTASGLSWDQHEGNNGAAPAVSACGTSPTIAGSDTAGEVTTGTGSPTACSWTFATAYAAQPYCQVQDRSTLANLTSYAVTNTGITITNTAASSQKVVYHCIGA